MRSTYLPDLDPQGERFAAVVDAITADIRRGRLRPGERLPGSRALADSLDLGRNTVVRAYRELEAAGWLEAVPSSGMRVARRLDPPVAHRAPSTGLGFDVPGTIPERRRTSAPPGCRLALLGGQPDLRLLPLTRLARAYRRVLHGRGRRLVGYGDPFGEPRLRQALATWLAETRGLPNDPSRLFVTRGSQMALYLLATTLFQPGDRVAVERLGYAPAWDALHRAGVALVPVDVDDEGLVVDALPDDVRGVYLTPHHQYPTGALLSVSRRMRLLAWAAARRVALLEDDYDHEYHYEGRPVLPLAALDRHGVVVYIGTLSKAFAPGLRLGWVGAAPELLEVLAARRRTIDRQGDRVVELAVAELLDDGIVQRHIRKTRRVYARRRQALLDELRDLPVHPHVALGGMSVWCRSEIDPDAWAERAERRGVFFSTGSAYTLDGSPTPHLRLGFAPLTVEELAEACAILRATVA